jgi:uncharacterized membrane protein
MWFWIVVLFGLLFVEWIGRRQAERRDDERFARLVGALNRYEGELKKLTARVQMLETHPAVPAESVASVSAVESPAPPAAKPVAVAPGTPPPLQVPPAISPPVPSAIKPTTPVSVPPPARPHQPPKPAVPPSPQHIPVPPAARGSTPPRTPFASPDVAAPPELARRRATEFEEKVGQNWLNKIGITVLVIGIALFLAYKFPTLTNPEKVILGYVVSLGILALGIYLESAERYRIFARALIGGGWALTFFVTYGMYFVKYTQVIETQWVDLVLLFIVAAAMAAHTLRYNSQVVTGLAFLLAFTTVAISQNTVYCLAAGAILAVGLVIIVHRRGWFELEVFGLVASYFNHYIWLRTVIEPMGADKHTFPEFVPSAVLLCMYWAIYRWSYVAREIRNAAQEHVSAAAALLNTSLLIVLLKYQSVHPKLAFYALLVLGAAELAIGQLPMTRRRRPAFVTLSTIGTILVVAAIPFKFSGMDIAIIWLAEAEAFLLVGVFTRERIFRILGMLGGLLASCYMLLVHLGPIVEERSGVAHPLPEYRLAATFGFAALIFYADADSIPARWKDAIAADSERICFRALSYLAGVMLFGSLWLAFPDVWMAVAWSTAAFALCLLGWSLALDDLSHQAHAFAAAAVCAAFLVNCDAIAPFAHTQFTQRLVTLSLVAALLYLCARWAAPRGASYTRSISETYTTAAAAIVVAITYYECHWAWMAVAWGAFAAILAVLGFVRKRRDFSVQAHLLALAGFARTLFINIDATETFHGVTLRFITFSIMTVLLYLCARFSGPRDARYARIASAAHTFAGSVLAAVLAYKEVSSPWIAVVWAAFALVLLIAGDRLKRIELHVQAFSLSLGSLVQIALVNLPNGEPFSWYPRITLRLVTLVLTAALFYASARWASRGDLSWSKIMAVAYGWAGSSLVGAALLYELRPLNVALGWALFGLVIFEIGMARKSMNARLQGYAAFSLAFLRIFYANLGASRHDLLVSVLPIAAIFYYAYGRLDLSKERDFLARERPGFAAAILSYLGCATVAITLYFALDAGWVAAGWAALALASIAVAWTARRDVFLCQSLLLAGVVFCRALFFNLAEVNVPVWPWMGERSLHVGVAIALLFGAQAFAFPLRARSAAGRVRIADQPWMISVRRPEQTFFFVPLALFTILLAHDVASGRVTIAWGVEAFVVFVFALMVGERSFRLTGLGLLLLCVAKILLIDVWRQERSDRFVTFITLGIALLIVSFLYSRYSEAIKRYL